MIKAAKERINKVSQAARISRQVSQISRNSMDSNYILASSRESSVVNLRKNISGTDSVRSATIRRSGAPARFNWDKRIVRFSHFFSHAKLLVIWPSHRVHRDCKPFNKGLFQYCVHSTVAAPLMVALRGRSWIVPHKSLSKEQFLNIGRTLI